MEPCDTAPKTFSPGAASDTHEPVFANDARDPLAVDAVTASPKPPTPFDPAGCRSAAGYSTGLPLVVLVAGGRDDEHAVLHGVLDCAAARSRTSSGRRR